MFRRFPKLFGLLLLASLCGLPPVAPIQPALAEFAIHSARDRIHPVFARNGMIASQEALAGQVGDGALAGQHEGVRWCS
jgi:hypothetical protein